MRVAGDGGWTSLRRGREAGEGEAVDDGVFSFAQQRGEVWAVESVCCVEKRGSERKLFRAGDIVAMGK